MRRMLVIFVVVAAGLLVSACSGDQGQVTPPASPTPTPTPAAKPADPPPPAEPPRSSVPEPTKPAPKPQASKPDTPPAGDDPTPATNTGLPANFGSDKSSLGTVRVPQRVTADGEPLTPGSYAIKLSGQAVKPVVGQSKQGEQWVEFSQGGSVKGRELATVFSGADVKKISKGGTPPEGTYRVDTLKGGDYIRVWINRDGTQYLIHLLAK